jgi:hypothetical protein
LKYIVFRSPEGPRVEIFGAPTTHADQAAAHPAWQPQAAGFIRFPGSGEVVCCGRSDSLNLAADPRDAALIEMVSRVSFVESEPLAERNCSVTSAVPSGGSTPPTHIR